MVINRNAIPHEERWWSAREAREYVRCGATQIYAAVRRGDLRFGRIGRRLRFRRQWLDAWLQKPST